MQQYKPSTPKMWMPLVEHNLPQWFHLNMVYKCDIYA